MSQDLGSPRSCNRLSPRVRLGLQATSSRYGLAMIRKGLAMGEFALQRGLYGPERRPADVSLSFSR